MQNPYQYDFPIPQTPQVPMSPFGGAAPQPGMGIAPIAQPPKAGEQAAKTPGEVAALAALMQQFGLQLKEQELTDQMAFADALRRKTPEGRDNGRVYSAANPLEHIGTAWQNYNTGKMRKEAEEERRKTNQTRGENVGRVGVKILAGEDL